MESMSTGPLHVRILTRIYSVLENLYVSIAIAFLIHLICFFAVSPGMGGQKKDSTTSHLRFYLREVPSAAAAARTASQESPAVPEGARKKEDRRTQQEQSVLREKSEESKGKVVERKDGTASSETSTPRPDSKETDPGSEEENSVSASSSDRKTDLRTGTAGGSSSNDSTAKKPAKKGAKEAEKNNRKNLSDSSSPENETGSGDSSPSSRWEKALEDAEKTMGSGGKKKSSDSETTRISGVEKKGKKRRSYFRKLNDHLSEHFQMPRVVNDERLHSTVVLSVRITGTGKLQINDTEHLSQYPLLNQVARQTIWRAKTFRKPPSPDDDPRAMTVRVTFRFHPTD